MKQLFTLLAAFFFLNTWAQSTSLYSYTTYSIQGDTIPMSSYAGKKLMIVNCASYCAYTPQYQQLQDLYDQYHQYNFEIIGFPSDDFGHQGGNDSQIIATCNSYSVTFPITEKINVNTSPVEPIFQWLKQSSLNGVANATVTWNFNKFLIDETGHWVKHYTQSTLPNDTAIVNWIIGTASGIKNETTESLITLQSTNPVTNEIRLTISDNQALLKVHLYSSDGKLVASLFTGAATQMQQVTVSTSGLQKGIYLLKAESNGVQQLLKLMVN